MSEMNPAWQQRTALLLGEEKMMRLRQAHVLVVGLGGVGAYAAEMICRAGVGRMTIVDADTVQPSNINRQLPATHATIGRPKAEVLAERFRDINPEMELTVLPVYLKDEAIPELLDSAHYDFIVDAIDTVAPKCYLIYHALQRGLKIISSMGAGAKRDITQVRFADLWETYHCGLSKAVRKRLQKMGMKRKLPVVFSTEQADERAVILIDNEQNKKSTAGTVSYMPAVFGCYLAEYVIRKL
ncbi:MAG: tRNA threonylcarbamoyladenosine dehydratase [Bacteroides sp.]|nr:tRNA threonylcarbamoyladenosine dehydratase [Bacteroides sp.]